jgi:hypothetical protein
MVRRKHKKTPSGVALDIGEENEMRNNREWT